MKRIAFCLLLCLILCGGTQQARAEDTLQIQSDALQLDELERAAEESGTGLTIEKGVSLDGGLMELLNTGTGELYGVVRKALRSGVLLLVIVLLCGLADGGGLAASGGGVAMQATPIAGALAVAAVSAVDVNSLIGLGRGAIDSMATFSQVLLPTMAAAAAAGGAPAGAAARQMATVLFSDLLIALISKVLLPLVYAYIAASTAYAALGNKGLKRVAGVIKWVVTTVLTTVLVVFVGYLSVSGVIAGTTDAITVKTAKFAMSSMVPVVGKILSDAAETVLAGAGILRNGVGVFGLLVVLGICLIPFLQMGVHYLTYKLTSALSATVADGPVVELIDSIGGAFGLVLAMTGSCAFLILVSLVSGISAAGVV